MKYVIMVIYKSEVNYLAFEPNIQKHHFTEDILKAIHFNFEDARHTYNMIINHDIPEELMIKPFSIINLAELEIRAHTKQRKVFR